MNGGGMGAGAGILLALAACSSTGPRDSVGHTPDNGRYAYQMGYAEGGVPLSFSGELVISNAGATTLTHTWSVTGFGTTPPTIAGYDPLLAWVLSVDLNSGARTVYNHLTRLQSSYGCRASIVGRINGVDQSFNGVCSFTYLGP